MAKFEMNGLDMLIEELERSADLSEVAPKMIDAATPILVKNLKKNIQSAASRGYATGALAESVHATKARMNQYGYFSAVGPTGTDKSGVRNGEKLAYLEYGTSRNGKQHQPPRPVMARTMNESEEAVVERMQEVFNAEVGK